MHCITCSKKTETGDLYKLFYCYGWRIYRCYLYCEHCYYGIEEVFIESERQGFYVNGAFVSRKKAVLQELLRSTDIVRDRLDKYQEEINLDQVTKFRKWYIHRMGGSIIRENWFWNLMFE